MGLFNLKQFRELILHSKKPENFQVSLQLTCVSMGASAHLRAHAEMHVFMCFYTCASESKVRK